MLDNDDAEVYLDALRDPDPQIQIVAARCIALRPDPRIVRSLLEAWFETEEKRGQIEPPLLRLITQVYWCIAILMLRYEAVLPTLLDGFLHDDASVQQCCGQVLAEAGARAAVWPAIELLESESSPLVTRVAAQLLARLGTESAMVALRRAFTRGDQSAQLGALEGLAVIDHHRQQAIAGLPVASSDAVSSGITVLSLERVVLRAQITESLEQLQPQVDAKGREVVLAEARAAWVAAAQSASARAATDPLSAVLKAFSSDDVDRVAAFETIQLLEGGDPESLLQGLFDPDSRVALRASAWIRAQSISIPMLPLLERLESLAPSETDLTYWAGIAALIRPEHIGPLIKCHRAGSRAAGEAIWLMCLQFGLRYYSDGRIEFPDGQVESGGARLVERLQQLYKAEHRPEPSASELEAAIEASREEYLAATETEPTDSSGWASRAALEAIMGREESALASLQSAIDADAEPVPWHRFRATLYLQNESFEEAARDLEQAIARGETRVACYADLGRARMGLRQYELAIKAFSKMLAGNPESTEALYWRAQAHFALEHYEEAVRDLDHAVRRDPAHVAARRLRARANGALRRTGAMMEDLAEMDAAHTGFLEGVDHEFWDAYLLRARQRLAGGERKNAHTDAKRVILANHLHPQARVIRARVWAEEGMPGAAIFDLSDLVGRYTEDAELHALRRALDELVKLEDVPEPANLTERQRADSRGVRGVVLALLEEPERAREDLEFAIAGGTAEWRILNTLAWLYADHFEINLDQASDLAQQALLAIKGDLLANDDDSALVLDTLGWSYYKRGHRAQALAALEEAVALAPGNNEFATRRNIVSSAGS